MFSKKIQYKKCLESLGSYKHRIKIMEENQWTCWNISRNNPG